jgi:hypothetical protein
MQSSSAPVPVTPPVTAPATEPAKSIFLSKTFWGAVCTAVAAIAPTVGQNVATFQEKNKVDPNGVAQIAVILATTGLTIIGRVDAKTIVYTPSGMPGPNPPAR